MKLLAFESSAKAAGTALLSDGCLLAEYMQNSGQTHSRTLMELAKNMLSGCDLTPQDIDAVAVAAGPGSFTGVRIGMACAKGFAWGRQLPLYGVSTLEAMVRGAACADGVYCACMDAISSLTSWRLVLPSAGQGLNTTGRWLRSAALRSIPSPQ